MSHSCVEVWSDGDLATKGKDSHIILSLETPFGTGVDSKASSFSSAFIVYATVNELTASIDFSAVVEGRSCDYVKSIQSRCLSKVTMEQYTDGCPQSAVVILLFLKKLAERTRFLVGPIGHVMMYPDRGLESLLMFWNPDGLPERFLSRSSYDNERLEVIFEDQGLQETSFDESRSSYLRMTHLTKAIHALNLEIRT